MTQPLNPNSEYLVATDLSEADLAQKIAELEEMRGLIATATARPMAERWQRHLQDQDEPLFYATFFVVRPDLYVLARVHESDGAGQRWCLSLSICDAPVSGFRPFIWHGIKERSSFHDYTMRGLEYDVPCMSKGRALAAIDRWVGLLSNPLEGTTPDQPPPAAVDCARAFIGSVAARAKKQGIADYVLPSLEDDPVNQERTVRATFPTARDLPQVWFRGWRNDDWDHEYEYLTQEAAAIYACALPRIISVDKTYSTGSAADRLNEPFGLSFRSWCSQDLPFDPSPAMDPALSQLPSLPVDAILPPIFSKD